MALEHRSLSYVPEKGEFIHCPTCHERMKRMEGQETPHSICRDCDQRVYLYHGESISTIPQITIRR